MLLLSVISPLALYGGMALWPLLVWRTTLNKIRGGPYSMPTPVQKNDLKIKNISGYFSGSAGGMAPDPCLWVPLGACSLGGHRALGALAVL